MVIWSKLQLKKLLVLLVLILVACEKEEIVTIEPIEPTVYLNHTDYDMADTSSALKEMGTCYEIFPISFADSDGDGYGDINGIIDKLDYLDNLGIECIWITPLTASPSYHKYDVVDYYTVDPIFGTNEDYYRLLDETDKLGIKVLMDFVINHTSSQHQWFIDSMDPESEYREYYRWSNLADKKNYPSYDGWHREGDLYYYGSFWDQMPDLNLDNATVREEMINIAKFWVEKGIDGFRLDAAKHFFDVDEYPMGTSTLTQSIRFLKEFNYEMKLLNEDIIILAEVWSDASIVAKYYQGTDTSFNFELAEDIINTINNGNDIGMVDNLINTVNEISAVREDYVDSIFLTNHDQNRVISRLGEDTQKARLAANMLFTLPGVSWIYYGEEVGMNGATRHEDIRQPMIWSDDYLTEGHIDGIGNLNTYNKSLESADIQLNNPESMYNFYRNLIELKTDDVLKYGDIQSVEKDNNKLIVFTRTYQDKHYLVIHSVSMIDQTVNIDYSNLIYSYNAWEEENVIKPYGTVVLEVDSLNIEIGQS